MGTLQCTEVRFACFLSGGFTNMAVVNPPERRLEKAPSRSEAGWLKVYQLGILSLSCSQYSQTICWRGWDDNACLGARNTCSIGAWSNSLDKRPPWYCIVSPLVQTNIIEAKSFFKEPQILRPWSQRNRGSWVGFKYLGKYYLLRHYCVFQIFKTICQPW